MVSPSHLVLAEVQESQGSYILGNEITIQEDQRWFKDGVDVNSVDIGEQHW